MANDYTPQQIEEILQMFFDVAGTRQYIGARYVPIFGRGRGTSVDWDNSDAYEPLSIVYYQGDTYTSRRYVPAGISIDNQDYWVITGRYNAQVEQYRQEVLGFADEIDAKIPWPIDPESEHGALGQVLGTLANGRTKWVDPVVVTSEVAGPLIDAWLDEHPEATTTVLDGSITTPKLANGAVTYEKLAAAVQTLYRKMQPDMLYAARHNITDLDDAETNSTYLVIKTDQTQIDHFPSDFPNNQVATLTSFKAIYSADDDYIVAQVLRLLETDKYWVRLYNTRTLHWDTWTEVDTAGHLASIDDTIADVQSDYLKIQPDMLYNTRYAIDDLDDAEPNSAYVMVLTVDSNIANVPDDLPLNKSCLITTYKATYTNLGRYWLIQEIEMFESDVKWVRVYVSQTGWLQWTKTDTTGRIATLENAMPNYMKIQPDMLYDTRYAINDLNDAEINSTYLIVKTVNTNIDNFPDDFPNNKGASLITYKAVYNDSGTNYWYIQVLSMFESASFWSRIYLSTQSRWTDWVYVNINDRITSVENRLSTVPLYVECGPGKQYTRLRDAVDAAMTLRGSTVIVYPGTYDLTQEFATEIAAEPDQEVGIRLGNDVTVNFMSGSYVKALFPTSNDWISVRFAPFSGRNFTMIGANIESSNCRYCVHDEQGASTEPYHNVYIDCIMAHHTDKSGSGITGNTWHACIGAGLGKNGHVEIVGGKYTADGDADPNGECPPISFHNSSAADAYSVVSIRNVYIDGRDGQFRFGYYGPSTLMTPIMVCGCSMGGAIIERPENASALIDNFDVIAWNNEIRTP